MRRLDGTPYFGNTICRIEGASGSLANVNGGLSAAEDFRLTIDFPRDHEPVLASRLVSCKRRDSWRKLRRSAKQKHVHPTCIESVNLGLVNN